MVMEGHFSATREELYHVEMEVKHVQAVQNNHTDRLLRLEKRQADDASLKSVWNSPFPSVLSGTPQHGSMHTPSADVFDDFDDEQGQNLLGSLHIDTEEEPVRRGASRANSVRFDVSAIHGSNWASSRSSGDFGPARPSSGFSSHAMTERSYSHKSDGRHSSAGHSVHSMHSMPSGRTSSLGLDTNFLIGAQDGDSPVDVPEPPPGLFILGSVPSIIRCWLNKDFSHGTLLYAVLSTGSQRSTIDFSLIRALGLTDQVQRNSSRSNYITLPVYLPEAIVTQPSSRAQSPLPQLPTLTADFEVTSTSQHNTSDRGSRIQVFLGSDTLRAHNADLLFSQNSMTLYGDAHERLSVPFVRPEEDSLFKDLCTVNMPLEKVELKATALPFTPHDQKKRVAGRMPELENVSISKGVSEMEHALSGARGPQQVFLQNSNPNSSPEEALDRGTAMDAYRHYRSDYLNGNDSSQQQDMTDSNRLSSDNSTVVNLDARDSGIGIWGSWRSSGTSNNAETDPDRESISGSGYSRAGRGGRSMKILKPSKPTHQGRLTSSTRTGATYEPPTVRSTGEPRRKSQAEKNGALRWEPRRTSSGEENANKEPKLTTNVARSLNPIGGASAFAWMNPGKAETNSSTTELKLAGG